MNLDEKIKKIRKDNKMSQDDFAEILNVTRQTVSNWENKKNYPDIETLIKISDEFNISLDILLKENMVMVKEIDRNVKNTKRYKMILVIIACILVIIAGFFSIYGINYFNTKDKLENSFKETLEEYHFYKNRDGYYSMKYDEYTTFGVPNQQMPNFFDFSLHFHNSNLYCDIENETYYIEITWSAENKFSAATYSKDNKETIGSTANFKKEDFRDMKKLSEELQIEESKIKEIIDKGNMLYKEFYN